MNTVLKILIIVAMQQEADPLIKELGLVESAQFDNVLPMKVYTSDTNPEIILVVNGVDETNQVDLVGTQAASITALMSIQKFDPDVVINFGTAGGVKDQGAEIGDVYLVSKVFYHDRRIPLPGFDEYGIGGYECDTLASIADQLNLKKGILSTGNSLHTLPRDLEIMNENNAILKDMEAASIVWIADLYEKPTVVIKAVTDYADYPEPDHQDFVQNLNLASHNLKSECLKLLDLLSENKDW